MNKNLGIYVHIPFCKSKCYYCDFCSREIDSNSEDGHISDYVDAICAEILNNVEILSERGISSIYFGGGTPSYIKEEYIGKIMNLLSNFICRNFDNESIECTIELNPADVTEEKLKKYSDMGFNRFSLGLQSINDETLKKIGRRHTKQGVESALNNFKKAGINNVSLDIITGLPGETEEMFKKTLDYIVSIKGWDIVKHISIYSLELHKDTQLGFLVSENMISLPSEDDERNMKHMADKVLRENGFNMYEISNYSIKGYESKHNLNYWECGEYIGFGVAASSYINSTRYSNTNNINEYISNIKTKNSIILEKDELDKLGLMKEFIILNLRLNKGVIFSRFKEIFNTDIFSLFNIEISKNISNKLLIYIKDDKANICGMRLTDRGRDLANQVWQSFI